MPTQEDYDNCEAENRNLRDALAWASERLSVADQDVLETRLADKPIEDGGVTGTTREDERQDMVELIVKLVAHVEPLTQQSLPAAFASHHPYWMARLDLLLNQAREYQPKHPLMRRIGGHPNVFAPVRGKV